MSTHRMSININRYFGAQRRHGATDRRLHSLYCLAEEHKKNPENTIRGLKAAIHNPNLSDEAKAHAAGRLQELEARSSEHEISKHQLGGYKATLTNKHTSQEAKDHARQMLETEASGQASDSSRDQGDHEHHVLGGYKSTLKNPRVSDEARHHAEDVLKQHHTLK
ncbi:hypothetical protein B0H34DRAFT_93377 [Crassisporium funariophilum]|nr:hypothetical protein B0H34DRAFT_93377 [Crassisporium funariophilum]